MSRTTRLALAVAARVPTEGPLLGMFVLVHCGGRGGGAGDAAWNAPPGVGAGPTRGYHCAAGGSS